MQRRIEKNDKEKEAHRSTLSEKGKEKDKKKKRFRVFEVPKSSYYRHPLLRELTMKKIKKRV